MTKTELTKLLESYELTALDERVIQTWRGKIWSPKSIRTAASDYMRAAKQTPSLLLWAVYILDQYGLFREISRKGREDFLSQFD